MTYLLVLLAILIALSLAAALGKTPDTHRQASPHGDLSF